MGRPWNCVLRQYLSIMTESRKRRGDFLACLRFLLYGVFIALQNPHTRETLMKSVKNIRREQRMLPPNVFYARTGVLPLGSLCVPLDCNTFDFGVFLELLSRFELETSSLPTDCQPSEYRFPALWRPFCSGKSETLVLSALLSPTTRFLLWVNLWVRRYCTDFLNWTESNKLPILPRKV